MGLDRSKPHLVHPLRNQPLSSVPILDSTSLTVQVPPSPHRDPSDRSDPSNPSNPPSLPPHQTEPYHCPGLLQPPGDAPPGHSPASPPPAQQAKRAPDGSR